MTVSSKHGFPSQVTDKANGSTYNYQKYSKHTETYDNRCLKVLSQLKELIFFFSSVAIHGYIKFPFLFYGSYESTLL